MFDIDEFINRCLEARAESSPLQAVAEVLREVVARPDDVLAALPPDRAELVPLHVSPELTVLKVVWAPGMTFHPHDHRMWAAIGICSGGEDNTFYRRAEHGIVESGGRQLRAGDVCLLGDDTIHAVTNPTDANAGAIHVYGGDLLSATRSEWRPDTFEEQPYDVDAAREHFEQQNASIDRQAR
jgi:predicted metal-dependent enzyme (double-stranded beta helix superfamily)